MNRHDKHFATKGEAKLRYLNGEFQILQSGSFVRCAVTGQLIPLDELRYWNVDLQEPYASAEVAFRRFRETRAATAARRSP